VGSKAIMDVMEKRIIFAFAGNWTPALQPVTLRYTEWAT
jgi:hypothetical protein